MITAGNSPIATSDHTIMITVISSVTTFVLSSVLFFILGVIFAGLCQSRHYNKAFLPQNHQATSDSGYIPALPRCLSQDVCIELKENSAYESVKFNINN